MTKLAIFDNPAPANADAGELLSLDRCVTAHEVTDQLVPGLTTLEITVDGFPDYHLNTRGTKPTKVHWKE